MLPRPKLLKIINHKVNKTMHSTVVRASLLSSRTIENFLFPTYEVVSASSEPCCSLRPTPHALIGFIIIKITALTCVKIIVSINQLIR